MLTQFSRTELLFGKEAMDKLAGSKVAVFGIVWVFFIIRPDTFIFACLAAV